MNVNTEADQMAWGSHQCALLGCLGRTSGAVLELGMGHFSTPLLHHYCQAAQRDLVSVESDLQWYKTFSHYIAYMHKLILAEYDDVVPKLAQRPWSVVLIDNSPGGARRAKDFTTLWPNSEYVVIHDYHQDNEEAIGPLLTGLKTRIFTEYQPPTLVVYK